MTSLLSAKAQILLFVGTLFVEGEEVMGDDE